MKALTTEHIQTRLARDLEEHFEPVLRDQSLTLNIDVKPSTFPGHENFFLIEVSSYYKELLDDSNQEHKQQLLNYHRYTIHKNNEGPYTLENARDEIIKTITYHAIWTAIRNKQDVNILQRA